MRQKLEIGEGGASMNKKIVGVLATVIIIGSALAGWLVYRNQQTVPNGLINQGYQTVDARQSDNTMVNHLGISVALFLSKNSATINGFQPVGKKSYLGNSKLINSNTPTAKSIYKALTGHSTFNTKDYLKLVNVDLGRVYVIQHESSWTLKSKKLTLTFHKTTDGNWATPDGTLWFPVKTK